MRSFDNYPARHFKLTYEQSHQESIDSLAKALNKSSVKLLKALDYNVALRGLSYVSCALRATGDETTVMVGNYVQQLRSNGQQPLSSAIFGP